LHEDTFLMNQQLYNNQNNRMWTRTSTLAGSPLPTVIAAGGDTNSLVSIYERPAPFVNGEAERDTNQWQVFGAWNPNRYSMQLDPGYEYTVLGADWFGEPEYVSNRFLYLPPELQQAWAGPMVLGSVDTSVVRVDRTGMLVASITKGENRMPLVLRRPFFRSTDKEDQFGWEIIYHDQNSSAPQLPNIAVAREPDFEYIVLCANQATLGATSAYYAYTWDKISDVRRSNAWSADLIVRSIGQLGWSYDGKKLLTQQGVVVAADVDWRYAPYGVYMVLRRRMRAWEPSEVIAGG
jgi:hypothetical protein